MSVWGDEEHTVSADPSDSRGSRTTTMEQTHKEGVCLESTSLADDARNLTHPFSCLTPQLVQEQQKLMVEFADYGKSGEGETQETPFTGPDSWELYPVAMADASHHSIFALSYLLLQQIS